MQLAITLSSLVPWQAGHSTPWWQPLIPGYGRRLSDLRILSSLSYPLWLLYSCSGIRHVIEYFGDWLNQFLTIILCFTYFTAGMAIAGVVELSDRKHFYVHCLTDGLRMEQVEGWAPISRFNPRVAFRHWPFQGGNPSLHPISVFVSLAL